MYERGARAKFFLDERTEKYDRYDELHLQRTFPVQQYTEWLTNAGFELLGECADFKNAAPKSNSERIFLLRKNKHDFQLLTK